MCGQVPAPPLPSTEQSRALHSQTAGQRHSPNEGTALCCGCSAAQADPQESKSAAGRGCAGQTAETFSEQHGVGAICFNVVSIKMGCANASNGRSETVCLYRGKVFELKQRPGTWDRLYNELRRVIGREKVEVSVVQPDCKVTQVTENTWHTLYGCRSRLVLVVQPESQEETLNLEMTGKRSRDRKYSQVSRILRQLKSATEEFDSRFASWYLLACQPSFQSAVLFTCAQVSLQYREDFPYFYSEGSANALWQAWKTVTEQMEVLGRTIEQTRKAIERVANKRAIKRLGVFKKAAIDTAAVKAQENNVKLSMTQAILTVYAANLSALQASLLSLRLRSQQTRTLSKVGAYLALCT